MNDFPVYISILFALTTLLTVWLFIKATPNPKSTIIISLTWLALQVPVALSGFYTRTGTVPTRFLLLVLPPVLTIVILFITPRRRKFIDSLNVRSLTILHIIRVPVELVLLLLFINKGVPELMTFEGRNFDILSGLSAPVIYYFAFVKKRLGRNLMLVWNFICLGLLINIVANAILSAPFPFQQFAFDQPNIAILYFPFIWLPAYVVPVVLLAHLAAIRQLMKRDVRDS